MANPSREGNMLMRSVFASPAVTRYNNSLLSPHDSFEEDSNDPNHLRLFGMAFRQDNKIHMFPPCRQLAQMLRDVVDKHWTVDSDEYSSDCYTLNLKGTPFLMYSRRENAMLVKYICCLILERFKSYGWTLAACTDVSRRTDLTAWYFARGSVGVSAAGTRRRNASGGRSFDDDHEQQLVCLSLSAKQKLQLINGPSNLQKILYDSVNTSYELGIDHDSKYGRDYQIKMKGSPWDTEDRDEIVNACELISDIFDEFARNDYHFYGLVNLKDTADSFFFEYDPKRSTGELDGYMVLALDGHHILRLAKADSHIVRVIKSAIDQHWPSGLDAEGQIACGRRRAHNYYSPRWRGEEEEQDLERVSWEFVLKGSPWEAPQSKIGQSRQLVTHILDALLQHGWACVTGLEISRSVNKKSALLFKRCSTMSLPSHHRENGSLRHACLSPLGTQKYQLINAPSSLHRLVRDEFRDVLTHEQRTSDHQSAIWEMTFSGRPWWVINPDQERNGYILIRKRMGKLLESLTEAGWRLVASASVARLTHEDKDVVSGDIHSWFLLDCGCPSDPDGSLGASADGRGSSESIARATEPRIMRLRKEWSEDHHGSRSRNAIAVTNGDDHGQKGKRSTSTSKLTRVISPPPVVAKAGATHPRIETQRSHSGSDILGRVEPPKHPGRFRLTNGMKSQSTGM